MTIMKRLLALFALVLAANAAHAAVQAPVLKWAYGGCFTSWCQTGWYSSPAVIDIDLAKVSFLDCSGVGVLVAVRNTVEPIGCQVRISHHNRSSPWSWRYSHPPALDRRRHAFPSCGDCCGRHVRPQPHPPVAAAVDRRVAMASLYRPAPPKQLAAAA